MQEMTINNRDINEFGARLLNFSVGGTEFTQNTAQASGICDIPRVWSTSFAHRTLSVTLVFRASKLGEDSKNTSIFQRLNISTEYISQLESYVLSAGTVTMTLPDGFCYTGIIKSIGAAVYDGSGEQEVAYTFTVVRHKQMQTVPLLGNTTIQCISTTRTHCCVNITADKQYNSIIVMGITINDISAGDNLIIDGINGKITLNGENKFSDCDLIDFPTLFPGKNLIENTAETAQGSISYYPVYI